MRVRIHEIIGKSIDENRMHPTEVLNALIALENEGGIAAVYALEYHVKRLRAAALERGHSSFEIIHAWWEACVMYTRVFGPLDLEVIA
jgi:hypothetical protein